MKKQAFKLAVSVVEFITETTEVINSTEKIDEYNSSLTIEIKKDFS